MRSKKGFGRPKVKFEHLHVKCDHQDPRLTPANLKSAYVLETLCLETQFLFKIPHWPKILLFHSNNYIIASSAEQLKACFKLRCHKNSEKSSPAFAPQH